MLLVVAAGLLLFVASVTTTRDISSNRLSLVLLLVFPIAWTATRWAAQALVGRSRERTLIVGSSKVADMGRGTKTVGKPAKKRRPTGATTKPRRAPKPKHANGVPVVN